MNTEALSNRFKVFAERECLGSSRLYAHLSENIAIDPELLQLAAYSRSGQPVPNLLLGVVHYLLLKGAKHELASYYASIVSDPREPTLAIHYFKDFCKQNKHEIIPILKTKLVQTNEVRRCSFLYPSFCRIYRIARKPLALIEIGTSAGLQLLWDRYSYSYPLNSNKKYGRESSPLEITSEIRSGNMPFLLEHSPPVTMRIGLDLHINNLSDPEHYLWLKSLIWPEHKDRVSYFEKAALCLKDQPLELIEGDGVSLLPDIASRVPRNSSLCIFHTHVANQMSHDTKAMLERHIRELGKQRDVFHLYNNMSDLDFHLDYYLNGKEHKETLARTDGHGRWFQWLLNDRC